MTAYAQEMRRCQVVLLLRAVIAGHGSMCAAARSTGLHRNTVRRVLRAAGYQAADLRRLAKVHYQTTPRKTVTDEVLPRAARQDWRMA
jgi:DNA-binding phage protein